MNQREAILSGVKCATITHDRLGTRGTIEKHERSNVDIFGSIVRCDAVLLFRPLKNLLGACLDGKGIVISTNRPLSVQRFTGSHEFGHIELDHDIPFSLDGEEILKFQPADSLVELEANSFASEFLLPKWLFAQHAKRPGWTSKSLASPLIAYQMSLRVGASYEATVRSLGRHLIISESAAVSLRDIAPKEIKQKILAGYIPEHYYRDVWVLTRKDENEAIEGQPDDIFYFQVNEKSGSGYLWDFEDLKTNGFNIINDQRITGSEQNIGSDVARQVRVDKPKQLRGELNFTHCRPWKPAETQIEHLGIHYDLLGKEIGLPRSQRPSLHTT